MTSQILVYTDRSSIVNEGNDEHVERFRRKENGTKLDHVLEVELDREADGTVVHVHLYAWRRSYNAASIA